MYFVGEFCVNIRKTNDQTINKTEIPDEHRYRGTTLWTKPLDDTSIETVTEIRNL